MEIPDRAVWYIRGAMNRALMETEREIDSLERSIRNFERDSIVTRDLDGIIDYNRQWLSEARAYFADLPDDIRPSRDLLTPITPFLSKEEREERQKVREDAWANLPPK